MDPTRTDVINVIATAAVAIEAITLGLLGVLYAVYAQFAEPDETGQRMPVLQVLRTAAQVAAAIVVINSFAVGIAVWWLVNPSDWLYNATIGLFAVELMAAPIISVYLVAKLFR